VKILEGGLFGEFSLNHLSFMPLGVVPDHTDFLVGILLHQLSKDDQGFHLVTSFDWIDATLACFLVEEP